jgi:DNA replication protein DnaC
MPQRHSFGRTLGCRHCQTDGDERRTPEQAAQHAAGLVSRRLSGCGLAGRYTNATLDNFKAETLMQRQVLKACRQFAEGDEHASGRGLWLLGPVGTGKTHLLCAMARHLQMERCIHARVRTPRAIVSELRACWAKDAERKEADVLASLTEELDVLMLDEAGLGFGSESELLQLFEVIDARYSLRLPTCLASNLSAVDLKSALGDRIFDRLREGARVLQLDWASHRGQL